MYDVCLILGGDGVTPGINDNQYKEFYWGSLGVTGSTYQELLSMWPKENPKLPNEEVFISYFTNFSGGE